MESHKAEARFDLDSCFTVLARYDEHDRWSLCPTATVRENRQRYRNDTMILEPEFACDGCLVRVIDFMPMSGRATLFGSSRALRETCRWR
jgi:hypothetical protein